MKSTLSNAAIHNYATHEYDAGIYSAALQEMARELEYHRGIGQKHFDDSTMADALTAIAERLAFVANFPSADANARDELQTARDMLAKHIRELRGMKR